MCGRYALYGPTSRLREQFDLDDGFDFELRYNIAPTTKVLIVQAGIAAGATALAQSGETNLKRPWESRGPRTRRLGRNRFTASIDPFGSLLELSP